MKRAAAFGGSAVPRLAGLDGEPKSGPDMNPMIGVALLLLILFVVVTPAHTGYAKLPRAATGEVVPGGGITLGIDDSGKYFVRDKPVTDVGLEQALRDAYATMPGDRTLYLKAHDQVDYSRVLTAVDAARRAEVRRITAIVEPPRSPH